MPEPPFSQLGRAFAYIYASSVIDTYYSCAQEDGDREWHDLAEPLEETPDILRMIAEAIQYLDTRGLIQRDPAHPTWIAVRDESEATEPTELAPLLHLPL